MDNFGSIFSDTVGMGDKSSNRRDNHKSENRSFSDVYGRRDSGSDNNDYAIHAPSLNTLYKNLVQKMATVKIGWLLFNLLGYPAAFIAIFASFFGDTFIETVPEPYKTIVILLGVIFLIIKIGILGEHLWERHLNNLRKSEELKRFMQSKNHNNKH